MTARIEIDISAQCLKLVAGSVVNQWSVSTAANGPGEQQGSECTPRGKHQVVEKVGAGAALNTVFVGRVPTGEIYQRSLRAQAPERDWILTRVLWLGGCEPGLNAGGEVDTQSRYIYIHGAPDDVAMGSPGSHGCIRMRNLDVITLFDQVAVGTDVVIFE